MPISSRDILLEAGYDFFVFEEGGISPEVVDIRFRDLLPSLARSTEPRSLFISGQKLYKHQYDAYNELIGGKNVILISGTGSGKTEAWLVYALQKRPRTLAVYPTLALANDQISRIKDYARTVGLSAVAIDARRRDLFYRGNRRRSDLKDMIGRADIVVTNPAFLMQDLKRWAVDPKRCIFSRFFGSMGLIVLDELDFYGPRELSLLLSMLKVLGWISEKRFQISVLTATLGNPQELAEYLEEISGRDTAIIGGRPFRVPNRTYLVLGKNLKSLWDRARSSAEAILSANVGEDVRRALEDFDTFRGELYKVIAVAESLSLELPKPYTDIVEILSKYVGDEGVTLVFTRSISRAEEIGRKLRQALPKELGERIATHHHLISKERRELAERGAKEGRVKILISPRTLSQGIDIGTIVRIVHVGLPDDVREFHQREGRKGRRKDIAFTETIIIPSSRWDRELLTRGVEALRDWMDLPLEKTVVNKDNKYGMLFEALFKILSSDLRTPPLTETEHGLLKELRLLDGNTLSRRGKRVWEYLNFYEFAPPFGIKRIKRMGDKELYLEDISFCDLVEKFQPGCIDYTEDAVVTYHRLGGRTGRVVTAVLEEPLREGVLWRHDAMAYAMEEYEKSKSKWGESPNIFRDYVHGRLHSEVVCVVNPPKFGFGRYNKMPNRVIWILEGEKTRVISTRERTLPIRDRRVIEVPTPTHGIYNDYTYGIVIELDSKEDLDVLRIGLAYLMVVLRTILQIPFETIMYSLAKVGERKLLSLHEPEAAGLLEKLDWLEILSIVKEFRPTSLSEILMQVVDEDAHMEFVNLGLRWDIAREAALRILEYLLLRERITISLRDRKIAVPKPSPALNLLALDLLDLPLDENGNIVVSYLGIFDGEMVNVRRFLREYYLLDKGAGSLESSLLHYLNKGFNLLVYDSEQVMSSIENSGLKSLSYLFRGLEQEGKLIDVREEVKELLGLERAPLEEVASALGIPLRTPLLDVYSEYEESRRIIRDKPYSVWLNFTKYLSKRVESYLREKLEKVFLLHLISKEMGKAGARLPQ